MCRHRSPERLGWVVRNFGVAWLFGSAAVFGQDPCNQKLVEASRHIDERTRYQERNGICEGRYEQAVDARSLALVSLAYAHPSGVPETTDTLRISVPADARIERVEASSLKRGENFRMDALLDGELDWTLRLVSRFGLDLKHLGFLGRAQESVAGAPADVLIPVEVSPPFDGIRSRLRVRVRARRAVDSVTLSWARFDEETGDLDQECAGAESFEHPVGADGTRPKVRGIVELELVGSCSDGDQGGAALAPGLYRLTLVGEYTTSEGARRRTSADPAFVRLQ